MFKISTFLVPLLLAQVGGGDVRLPLALVNVPISYLGRSIN